MMELSDNMNRIVFFDGTLREGGAERVISILSNVMAQTTNYKVSIALWYDEEPFYEIDERVDIIRIPQKTKKSSFFGNFFWLRKYMKNECDTIISFLAPFNVLALLAHLGLKCPIIVADRNNPKKVPSNFFIRKARDFLYLCADRVVLQTEQNDMYFSYIKESKRRVIYNPICLKEKTGLALGMEKKKKIVSVGRLIEQKNQKMMINAFSKLEKKYPNYELWIYGEGNYRDELERLIRELGLEKKVFLPGNSKDIFTVISDAEFFVMSSNYEGMPNALLEAMCLGLPVISTKVSGAIDVIKNEYNGLLVDIDDIDGLIIAMDKLFSDEELRANLAKSACQLAEELAPEKIVSQWWELIEQCKERQKDV